METLETPTWQDRWDSAFGDTPTGIWLDIPPIAEPNKNIQQGPNIRFSSFPSSTLWWTNIAMESHHF